MSPAVGRRVPCAAPILALAALLGACSPALDWREVRPAGDGVSALFPCRPDKLERTLPIAGVVRRMQMHTCEAAGSTFSLAIVDAGEPSQVEPLLAAMRASVSANIGGAASSERPFAPPGATPNPRSVLLLTAGRLPDGRPVSLRAGFFVHGVRVYQATTIGPALSEEDADSFFGGFKLPR